MLYPREPAEVERDRRIVHWEQMRAGGRRAFVLRTGVIKGGLPLGLATLGAAFIAEFGWRSPLVLPEHQRFAFLVALLFFCGMGWLIGARAWEQGEAQYRKLKGGDS
jgi:hypothetical protein